MYRVDGSSDLVEETLEHWEGYEGSAPVRIGNGAANQMQMDIYGEALDSIYFAHQHGIQLDISGWSALHTLLEWLVDHWDQPGEGLWETRGGRKDFTYGRVMSWVAFDRALRLSSASGRPAARGRWATERDRGLRAGTDAGMGSEARGVRAALRQRCAGLVAAADADGGLHHPGRPDVDVHAGGDGPRTGQ